MGCTACTEPQCLYSTAIPLLPLWAVQPVHSLSAYTVQLYLYSPYGPYSLYRASVPVQYSYTSTPLSACTVQLYLYSPQCLYSTAIPLVPLWAVRPVQSLSACTRVHFTLRTVIGTRTASEPSHSNGCCTLNEFRYSWFTVFFLP